MRQLIGNNKYILLTCAASSINIWVKNPFSIPFNHNDLDVIVVVTTIDFDMTSEGLKSLQQPSTILEKYKKINKHKYNIYNVAK